MSYAQGRRASGTGKVQLPAPGTQNQRQTYPKPKGNAPPGKPKSMTKPPGKARKG